jgi:hypothetical protein
MITPASPPWSNLPKNNFSKKQFLECLRRKYKVYILSKSIKIILLENPQNTYIKNDVAFSI